MTVTFFQAPAQPPLTFKHVDDDQFFVDADGYFCQKVNNKRYVTIADSEGCPLSMVIDGASSDIIVKAIYPHVTKIKF